MFFGKKQKSVAEVKEEVRRLGWWYQHFQLPCGVMTGNGLPPAYPPDARWKLMEPFVPQDLSGQTVLDVGGNAGYFSIQMMLRGAKRCVLVEPYVEFSEQAKFVAEQFNVKLEVINDDVHAYCLTTADRFDYVLFLGLFYHLKYPVLVLDRLAEMTIKRMYFQSYFHGAAKDIPEQPSESEDLDNPDFPRMAFIEKIYKKDPTNWWIPNYPALEPLLRSAGLSVIARPQADVLVAEPEEYFGKVNYGNMVFPRYGRRGDARFPGPQKVDAGLWKELLEQARLEK